MSIYVTISCAATANLGALSLSVPRAALAMTAAATPSTERAASGEVWTIVAEADVFVEFGETPNGTGPLRHRMRQGDVRQWVASAARERVAFAIT
jgi:nicotinamide mononucleotide (NMN) deamidase PncC